MDQLKNRINNAIGKSEDGDYLLYPDKHAELYKESLPGLANVLLSSKAETDAREYQKYDNEANLARKDFEHKSLRVRQFTFATTVFATLLSVMSGIVLLFTQEGKDFTGITSAVTLFLGLGGAISGSAASVFLNIVRGRKLLETWMTKRAKAEENRLRYFETVAEIEESSNSLIQPEQALARLEYFRRYQLEIQRNYYTVRSKELGDKSNKNLTLIAILLGVVALVSALSGILESSFGNAGWTSLAGFALIIQAYSTMVNNRELSQQNQRNSTRYDNTRAILSRLSAQLDDIRNAILSGKVEILSKYVEAVHEPLSNENRQWLESIDKKHSAIGRLEEYLKDNK